MKINDTPFPFPLPPMGNLQNSSINFWVLAPQLIMVILSVHSLLTNWGNKALMLGDKRACITLILLTIMALGLDIRYKLGSHSDLARRALDGKIRNPSIKSTPGSMIALVLLCLLMGGWEALRENFSYLGASLIMRSIILQCSGFLALVNWMNGSNNDIGGNIIFSILTILYCIIGLDVASIPMILMSLVPGIFAAVLLLNLPGIFNIEEAILCSIIGWNSIHFSMALLHIGPVYIIHSSLLARLSASMVLSTAIALFINAFLSRLSRFSKVDSNYSSIITFWSSFLLFWVILAHRAISLSSNQSLWSLIWQELFLTSGRLLIMLRWMGWLLFTVSLTSLFLMLRSYPISERFLSIRLQLIRKSYHFLSMAMFLPVLQQDRSFLQCTMMIALCMFILCEALRLQYVHHSHDPKVLQLSTKLQIFKNNTTDRLAGTTGPMLSHLWLLLGCALPMFITPYKGESKMIDSGITFRRASSGILSLGLLDSMAAIGGSFIRTLLKGTPNYYSWIITKWPGNNRTIFGSAIGSLSFICIYYVFRMIMGDDLTLPSLILRTLIVSGWEALGPENDNITLPLITWLVMR